MITAAAVCPHPPMLVPELAQSAAGELDELREAARATVRRLVADRPEHLVILGSGPDYQQWDSRAGGTLRPYGVDISAGGASEVLPLSLTIGAWLLDEEGWDGPRIYTTGPINLPDSASLLVMADGSACRSLAAPGYFDPRAEPFDAKVAAALAVGDSRTLAELDPDLGAELLASGTVPLIILGQMLKGAAIDAKLLCETAPFGVGYWVAEWTVR